MIGAELAASKVSFYYLNCSPITQSSHSNYSYLIVLSTPFAIGETLADTKGAIICNWAYSRACQTGFSNYFYHLFSF